MEPLDRITVTATVCEAGQVLEATGRMSDVCLSRFVYVCACEKERVGNRKGEKRVGGGVLIMMWEGECDRIRTPT